MKSDRHHEPGGFLLPEETRLLQDICAAIEGEPWFIGDRSRRQQFAREVLLMYQRGLVMPDKLEALCRLLARKHFVQSVAVEKADRTLA